jgi:hypothetical protein
MASNRVFFPSCAGYFPGLQGTIIRLLIRLALSEEGSFISYLGLDESKERHPPSFYYRYPDAPNSSLDYLDNTVLKLTDDYRVHKLCPLQHAT